MYDAQAALAGAERRCDKQRYLLVRFMAVQPVQIDMILDAPATAAQVTQQAAWQTAAQEGIGTTEVEPVVNRHWRVQQFSDYRGFVQLALTRARARLGCFEADSIGLAQGYRAVDGRPESG